MSPIYEYKCPDCNTMYELTWPKCDGGPNVIDCQKCGTHTAIKTPSLVAIAQHKSGFKENPIMMQDPNTKEERPLDGEHTLMGLPREEEPKEVQELLDIECLRDTDPAEYKKRKEEFQLKMLDTEADGGNVDQQELDTYHQRPGEGGDQARRDLPLDYPEPAHMQGKDWVKIGEKVVTEKGKRKVKPVLIDKSMIKVKGE